MIKEFREFFLRSIQVSVGTKKDQEPNYPIDYSVSSGTNTKRVKNRFLKNHYPNEGIFQKLFSSIPFKLNIEDTADNTNQGLTRIATDTVAINRTIKSPTDFATVITPEQLPEIVVGTVVDPDTTISTNSANGITIIKVNKDLGSSRHRANYNISLQAANDPAGGSIDSIYGNFMISGSRQLGYVDITTLATKIPSGIILVWNSDTPPTGYFICNGSNGTPNLESFRISTTHFIMKS